MKHQITLRFLNVIVTFFCSLSILLFLSTAIISVLILKRCVSVTSLLTGFAKAPKVIGWHTARAQNIRPTDVDGLDEFESKALQAVKVQTFLIRAY